MIHRNTGLITVLFSVAAAITSIGYVGCASDSSSLISNIYGSRSLPALPAGTFTVDESMAFDAPLVAAQSIDSSEPHQLPEVDAFPLALQPEEPLREWSHIVFHHTATGGGDVEAIDAVHRERTDQAGRPWLGIGYHFVIGNGNGMPDGLIEPTFRWKQQLHGAHAGDRSHNETGIGICLIGDFEESPPTQRQLASLEQLVSTLRNELDIPADHLLGHGELKATACPGRFFPLQEVIALSEEQRSWDGSAASVATVGL